MTEIIHTCKECFKVYKHFSTLKEHILIKHVNVNVADFNINQTEPIHQVNKIKMGRPKFYKCKLCESTFTTNYSLSRHINGRCKGIKQPNNIVPVAQLVFNPFEKNYLDAIADVMLSKMNTGNRNNSYANNKTGNIQEGGNNNMIFNTDNHIDNHTENNITQNNNVVIKEININPLGQENLSHLSQDTIISILNQGTNAVPALAKAIMDLPENRNIVITDKRNKKATVVNRDGELEIMELRKALTMCTTDNIDRVDSYYESYKDQLPKQNKSLQRMVKAHGLESDSDPESDSETQNDHFDKYMDKIQNTLELNKKPSLARLNKYREHRDQLTTARPISSTILTQS